MSTIESEHSARRLLVLHHKLSELRDYDVNSLAKIFWIGNQWLQFSLNRSLLQNVCPVLKRALRWVRCRHLPIYVVVIDVRAFLRVSLAARLKQNALVLAFLNHY